MVELRPTTSTSQKRKRPNNSLKPLRDKIFVLDIEDVQTRERLTREIEQLGGTVSEGFNDQTNSSPICVVSDYHRIDILEKGNSKNLTAKVKYLHKYRELNLFLAEK